MRSVAVAVSVALCGWIVLAHSDYDIVIYGSSPAAVSAAVQAKRMGKTAVVVSPETRIGGLTTGGLGQTDIGHKSAFGGVALEFYRDVARYYRDEANWGTYLAWSGFGWDATTGEMRFANREGVHFFAVGPAWGVCKVCADKVEIGFAEGHLPIRKVVVDGTERAFAISQQQQDRRDVRLVHGRL